MRVLRVILFVVSFVLTIVLIVSIVKTNKKSIYKQTSEFYINDYAHALLNSSQWYIYLNGKDYYNDTLNDPLIENDLKGVQMVVVTQLESENADITKIFNEYKIGKNEMGLLILLTFDKVNGDFVFKNITVEVGRRLRIYLPIFDVNQILDDHFFNYGYASDFDSKIVNLYFNLIKITSNRLYSYSNSYIENNYYNMNAYADEYGSYFGPIGNTKFTLTPLQVVLIVIVVLTFFGSGGYYIIFYALSLLGITSNRGGGGRSDGYFFRR